MHVTLHRQQTEAVALFANLKTPRTDNIFIAEGEKVVTRLLLSGIEIVALYLTEVLYARVRHLIEAHVQERSAEVIIGPQSDIESIVGFHLHKGILAAAYIPQEPSLEHLLLKSPSPKLLLVLNAIADAENMGSMYRSGLGVGATAVIRDELCISPWMRRSVRVSMGAVFQLPTITVPSLHACLEFLKTQKVHTTAAAITATATPIWEQDMTRDVAIVFGSEGYGVQKEVLDACDDTTMIPMPKGIDSFNVAIAQGMMLYEIMRQRAKK